MESREITATDVLEWEKESGKYFQAIAETYIDGMLKRIIFPLVARDALFRAVAAFQPGSK
jgi:hypothetical protein